MSALLVWFGGNGGTSLLLALGHSLWLGALACLFGWGILQCLSVQRTGARYALLLGSQSAVLFSTLLIWSLLSVDSSPVSQNAAELSSEVVLQRLDPTGPGAQTFQTNQAVEMPRPASGSKTPVSIPLYGCTWVLGASLVLIYRLVAYGRAWWLCRNGDPVTDGSWRRLLEKERRALSMGRDVTLRAVKGLKSPAVFGFFRPVILLPVTFVTGLPEEAIRAILAHELSHVRRWDPLMQGFQHVVEALFFFNPFIWLLSRWIGVEREARCDRSVSSRVDVHTYAQLLLDLSRDRAPLVSAQIAAIGDGRPSSLAERLRRLVKPDVRPGMIVPVRTLILALGLTAVALVSGYQAMGTTVETLSQQEWIQQIQSALAFKGREQFQSDWKPGDEMRVRGTIADPEGRPIPGAKVHFRMLYNDGTLGLTTTAKVDDTSGGFERILDLTDWPEHRSFAAVTMTVMAPGHHSETIEHLPTRKGEVPIHFQLDKGAPVEMVLVDEAGKPIPEVAVTLRMLGTLLQEFSVKGGRMSFRVPPHRELSFSFHAQGYREQRGVQRVFSPEGGQLEVTLTQGPPIRGIVTDADSGEPIEGAGVFRVHSMSLSGDLSAANSYWVGQDNPLVSTGKDGRFRIDSLAEDQLHWLVIQKEGYLAGFPGEEDSRARRRLGPAFAVSPGNEPANVRLIPQDEVEVTILLPENWPNQGGARTKVHYAHAYFTGLEYRGGHSHGSRLKRKRVLPENGKLQFTIRPSMAAPLSIGIDTPGGAREIIEGWTFDRPVVVDLRDQPVSSSHEVEYVIRFQLPDGAAHPEGQLKVRYVDDNVFRFKEVPLENGEAHFTLQQNRTRPVTFDSLGVVGYTFPPVSIPPQNTPPSAPVEWNVQDVQPAGALSVTLENLAEGIGTDIKVEKQPSSWNFWNGDGEPRALWSQRPEIQLPPGKNTVVLTPIPFGTRLQLSVRQGNMLFQSEPVVLQKEQALKNLTLRMPPGSSWAGQVLDPDGEPVPDTLVLLNLVDRIDSGRYSTHHFRTQTDQEGRFNFDRINFDLEGVFYVQVSQVKGAADLRAVLQPGEKEGDVILRLPAATDLDVQVVDAVTGAPLNGLHLECRRADIPDDRRYLGDFIVAGLPTNEEGWTRFPDMPLNAAYRFRVWLPLPGGGREGFNVTHVLPSPENGRRSLVIEVDR